MDSQANNMKLENFSQETLNNPENHAEQHPHHHQDVERLIQDASNLLKRIMPEEGSGEDEIQKYSKEYSELFSNNIKLQEKIKEAVAQKEKELLTLRGLQSSTEQILSSFSPNQKNPSKSAQARRSRKRNAQQIVRCHRCPVPGCCKSYGSHVSQRIHLKRKHPEYFEKYFSNQTKAKEERSAENEGFKIL